MPETVNENAPLWSFPHSSLTGIDPLPWLQSMYSDEGQSCMAFCNLAPEVT